MLKKNVLDWRRAVRRYLRVKLTGRIHLNDLFELKELEDRIARGLVKRRYHPTAPLAILSYTTDARFDRAWDEYTTLCRGLVYHIDTLEVVARPFTKFFNYGEPDAPYVPLDAEVVVTDKLDGSFGILFQKPSGGWEITTYERFGTVQSKKATRIYEEKYQYNGFAPPEGYTYLFEIIYPENRIVCDYGDMRDLVLLGMVDMVTGKSYAPSDVPWWDGPRAEELFRGSLEDALALPPREGREGVVIFAPELGIRLKKKEQEYLYLHRVVTGSSPRGIWKMMLEGRNLRRVLSGLPDEFHGWATEVYSSIADSVDEVVATAENALLDAKRIVHELEDGSRRAFAAAVNEVADKSVRGYVWQLYDGKDIRRKVLENADPGGSTFKPLWGDPDGRKAA